ncbi:MAG: hypothetical protein AAFN78_13710 [Pseudomonadota bacterium]
MIAYNANVAAVDADPDDTTCELPAAPEPDCSPTTSNEHLRIPKKMKEVMLWVHPTGAVVGSIFLYFRGQQGGDAAQDPLDVLNHEDPFLVLHREAPDEIFFCNKKSIVRVEYSDKGAAEPIGAVVIPCRLHMMDGSIIDGIIKESLPPENSRLFDYMNISDERFIKLHVDEHYRCLVNKAYIVRVVPRDAEPAESVA